MTQTKTCQHCGKEMPRPPRLSQKLWDKRRWCDRYCMMADRAPKPRPCQRCGVSFTPTSNRKRGTPFCSIQCANQGRPIKGPYRKMRVGEKVRTVHRVVKEVELGRPLLSTEIVHHSDHEKLNNAPSNLEVTNNSQHSAEHMKGNQHARRSRPTTDGG